MDKRRILEHYPFFRDCDPAFQKEMLAVGVRTELKRGTHYASEGRHSEVIALVGQGKLRVYKLGDTGREITLYHVQAGEVCLLNLSCLLSGEPCPASAVVEEDVQAVAFRGPDFRRWIDLNPVLRTYVFTLLSTHIAGIMSLVEEVAFKRMDRRLAEYLGKRFFGDGEPVRELAVTHERIAADLGSAREVISRLLKDFERARAVKLARGRIILERETVLRAMLAAG